MRYFGTTILAIVSTRKSCRNTPTNTMHPRLLGCYNSIVEFVGRRIDAKLVVAADAYLKRRIAAQSDVSGRINVSYVQT